MEGGLAVMPALLWFVNWEPLELPLRNPIRRLKLALMRRILALTYAAFESGRTIVMVKKTVAAHEAMAALKAELKQRVKDSDDEDNDDDNNMATAQRQRKVRDQVDADGLATLRQNSHEHSMAFTGTLITCIALVGATESTPRRGARQ